MGLWGNFTEWTLTCGGGKNTANRTCSEQNCPGAASKTEDGNVEPCPSN